MELETLSTSSDERRLVQDDSIAFAPLADSRSSSPYACKCSRLPVALCSLPLALAVHSRLSAKNRVPSYSKIHTRRPSTAVVQKYRSKASAYVQRNALNQHGLQLNSFDDVRLTSSLSSTSRMTGPRRLARSAHLHTLSNAGRLYHDKEDFTPVATRGGVDRDSPTQNRIRLKSYMGESKESIIQQPAPSTLNESTGQFEDEESEGASASEAEEGMDSVSTVP